MGYDRDLADRIRRVISSAAGLSERAMFGGVGFLIHGNMAVAASHDGGLLVRVDPARTEELVHHPGVHRFAMRGRTMDGWLTVSGCLRSADRVAVQAAQQVRKQSDRFPLGQLPGPPRRNDLPDLEGGGARAHGLGPAENRFGSYPQLRRQTIAPGSGRAVRRGHG